MTVTTTSEAGPVETNSNRPTAPGYCANCGRTPCGWRTERTGLCIASTCPKTEWDVVGGMIFEAREELSGMTIDDILAMCARVHEARRQAFARYQP